MNDSFTFNKLQSILPDRQLFCLPYLIDGKQTDLYFIQNNTGIIAAITNYGARLVSLIVPDKDNNLVDVIIGPGSIDGFRASKERYFGATIGRFGNRIANGKFTLDGKEYILSKNENNTTLHGGIKGFQDVVWEALQINENILKFSYLSKDGEEGFPGNLNVDVIYSLTDDNKLIIDYVATSDKRTIINLTNHAFFNLNGQNEIPVFNHIMQINADHYTPVDAALIPIGSIAPVLDSPFDFRKAIPIQTNVDAYNIQGYDINLVLNPANSDDLNFAVSLQSPLTGIQMNIYTKEPCILFYSGGGMKGENTLKNGRKDTFSTALVLETHQFPDAPNQKSFPLIIIEPGTTFETRSVYEFKSILK
jgi:aldose 1-epimerase